VPVDICIIVPVFDEEDNVLPTAREVAKALDKEPRPFELVFVDDDSRDKTWERIQEARRLDPRVRAVRHARRTGQSAALWTGIQTTTGGIIATLDGDLQNDPADLPRLFAELNSVDFVCGVRVNRRDNWLRRVSAAVARRARKAVLGADFRDTGCALRVFKRAALDGVFPFNGWHRFLPILVQGAGATTKEVPVNHRPRVAGVSKYGVWNRLGRGIIDLIGVRWYQKRRLLPVTVTKLPEEGR
jgi:dolichol-phosphate mannosyltransferase